MTTVGLIAGELVLQFKKGTHGRSLLYSWSMYVQSMRHRMCILNYLVIMILRVYALYNRSLRILVFLLALWAAQIIMSAYGLRTGYREQPFLSLGKLF